MNVMLTRLLVDCFLVNIAYTKMWVHITFVLVHLRKKLGAPVQPVQKFSLEPWNMILCSLSVNHSEVLCLQDSRFVFIAYTIQNITSSEM